MLTGLHFLLTYKCLNECDHCFLHCGPRANGTFTLEQVRAIFDEIPKLGTIRSVYFEGGEPFLFYPLMLEGLRMARKHGLETGIVTNGYWATSVAGAELWLKPLRVLGVADLSISDDAFHESTAEDSPAKMARAAAVKLGIPCDTICIEPPSVSRAGSGRKGAVVVGGGVLFKGRAAEKLTAGLPLQPTSSLTTCPHEDLAAPERVHLDCYGNVHLCQGLSMGNCFRTTLAQLVASYDPRSHPICGPLLSGGPARLAKTYGVETAAGYVDECHCCYSVRKALATRFPEYLAPPQVFGAP